MMNDEEAEELLNKLQRATMLREIAESRALDPAESSELKVLERELLKDVIIDAKNPEDF